MMVHNDKLYVVGIFECVDNNILASNITSWDGERWCNLGDSYFNNKISCITSYKGDIYVGGGFTMVDGLPCKSMAKWVGDEQNAACSEPVSAAMEPQAGVITCYPNPAMHQLRVVLEAPATDIQVFSAEAKNQSNKIRIDSRVGNAVEVNIEGLAPGWYFVVATLENGGRVVGRFVKT